MEAPPKSRTISRWRLAFRWCRIAVWFSIFLALVAITYLHLVGMPEFLKGPLRRRLRAEGFETQFASAWLGFGPDIVIENASFQLLNQPLSPKLSASRIRVALDFQQLLHRHVKVNGLLVQGGRLELPDAGAAGETLSVNSIGISVSLLPDDTVMLERGSAVFHGVHLNVSGIVTNIVEVANWGRVGPTTAAPANPNQMRETLRRCARTLDQIHFSAPPNLTVLLNADGHDPNSLRAELTLTAPGAKTPWGEVQGLDLAAGCSRPLQPGPAPFLRVRLSAKSIHAPQASGRSLELTGDLAHSGGTNLEAAVDFRLGDFDSLLPTVEGTRHATAVVMRGHVQIEFQTAPLKLLTWRGVTDGEEVGTPWGWADGSEVTFRGQTVPSAGPAAASWGPWAMLDGQQWEGNVRLNNLANSQFQITRLDLAGGWRAPMAEMTNIEATLYGGSVSGHTRINAETRAMEAGVKMNFDLHRLPGLLPPQVRKALAEFAWTNPPVLEAEARLTLPPWSQSPTNWWEAISPTLETAGHLSLGPTSWRTVKLSSLKSDFTGTNQTWRIKASQQSAQGGALDLDFEGNVRLRAFGLVFDSTVDPEFFSPLLPVDDRDYLAQASFDTPPHLWGKISGNWGQLSNSVAQVDVVATNFFAHGEKFDGLVTSLLCDRSNLVATNLQIWRGGGKGEAPLVSYNIASNLISMSNAVANLDTHIVPLLLGPISPWWLGAMGFDPPPFIQVSGSFVPGDDLPTDMRFAISGKNFRFKDATADQLSGQVIWKGRRVALTNVQGSLYGGTGSGWGYFDYSEDGNTDFRGRFAVSNILLSLVNKGLIHGTNRLEGVGDGHLAVTGGNTRDIRSWVASGDVSITRAALWDIKLFGVFSRAMDAVVPGSGDSRAYQAKAHYLVTNALLTTDDLEIRSTGFRLFYRGSVNTNKQLNARVEARVLRNTPLIGPLFSWTLAPLEKMFEYKIGGTLDTPTYQPLYLPNFLSKLTHPFGGQKELTPTPEKTSK